MSPFTRRGIRSGGFPRREGIYADEAAGGKENTASMRRRRRVLQTCEQVQIQPRLDPNAIEGHELSWSERQGTPRAESQPNLAERSETVRRAQHCLVHGERSEGGDAGNDEIMRRLVDPLQPAEDCVR